MNIVTKINLLDDPDFLCGKAKGRGLVAARETLILAGRRSGLSTKTLSEITGLRIATISRRHDAALLGLPVRRNV